MPHFVFTGRFRPEQMFNIQNLSHVTCNIFARRPNRSNLFVLHALQTFGIEDGLLGEQGSSHKRGHGVPQDAHTLRRDHHQRMVQRIQGMFQHSIIVTVRWVFPIAFEAHLSQLNGWRGALNHNTIIYETDDWIKETNDTFPLRC